MIVLYQVMEDIFSKKRFTLKDYFTYKIIKGNQVFLKPYKISNIKTPFDFYLYPIDDNLPSYLVKVKENEELIYFRRIFGRIALSGNKIQNIIYVVGKKKKKSNKAKKLMLFDINTKQNYEFRNIEIEEAFKQIKGVENGTNK